MGRASMCVHQEDHHFKFLCANSPFLGLRSHGARHEVRARMPVHFRLQPIVGYTLSQDVDIHHVPEFLSLAHPRM